MKTKNTMWLLIILFLGGLTACSSDRWSGGQYEGEVTVDGTRPTDAKPEKFSLVTGKAKRFVKMDLANRYLANCEIPIDDKYSAGITDDGRFTFDHESAVCNGVTVHAGDLDLEGNRANVSVTGTAPDGRSYNIEIRGIRK